MRSFRPLFVFGIARSGTNLLAGVLNAHHNVYLALDPLMPFFKSLRTALLQRTGDQALAKQYPNASAFQDNYFGAAGRKLLDIILTGDLNISLEAADAPTLGRSIAHRAALESAALANCLSDMRGDTFTELLNDLLVRVSAQSAKSLAWCGTKEVWTTDFIPLLARALPDARFIIIRRDPRAVVASLTAMARSDPSQAAHTISYMRHWRKEAALVDLLVSNQSFADRLLIVRYETLASEPERSVVRLCNFLGIPDDPSMTAPVDPDGAPSHGNSSYGRFERIGTTSIERWRDVLDVDLVKAIECHCGPEMLIEDYELLGVPPLPPDLAVARVAFDAHRHPGQWRSDSGNPEMDLRREQRRWMMLQVLGSEPGAVEIREHFLFAPFFAKLRTVCSRWTGAMVEQAL